MLLLLRSRTAEMQAEGASDDEIGADKKEEHEKSIGVGDGSQQHSNDGQGHENDSKRLEEDDNRKAIVDTSDVANAKADAKPLRRSLVPIILVLANIFVQLTLLKFLEPKKSAVDDNVDVPVEQRISPFVWTLLENIVVEWLTLTFFGLGMTNWGEGEELMDERERVVYNRCWRNAALSWVARSWYVLLIMRKGQAIVSKAMIKADTQGNHR